MKRLSKIDATSGPLGKSMIRFALPVFLSSLTQMLMNAADIAVLGNMAGGVAVASVAATGVIVGLIVSASAGISEGTRVLLARAVGAKDCDRCRTIISTSIIFAAAIGIILSTIGYAVSSPFLRLLKCPEDCFPGAVRYLSIYFMSAPLTLVYNFGAAIVSTSGNTKKPMLYMLVAGVVNIILNVIFCLTFNDKVAAVAIATVAGIGVSAVLVMTDLFKLSDFPMTLRTLRFDFHTCLMVLKYGLPMALNSAMYSISGLLMQPALNSFGSVAVAGISASTHIITVGSSFLGATASAQNTFMGQNFGAKNEARAMKAMRLAFFTSIIFAAAYGILAVVFAKPLTSLIIPGESESIAYGVRYISFIMPVFCMESLKYTFSNGLSVFGKANLHAIASFISVIVFRSLWIPFVFNRYPVFDIYLLTPVLTWTLGAMLEVLFFTVVYRRYKKGKLIIL